MKTTNFVLIFGGCVAFGTMVGCVGCVGCVFIPSTIYKKPTATSDTGPPRSDPAEVARRLGALAVAEKERKAAAAEKLANESKQTPTPPPPKPTPPPATVPAAPTPLPEPDPEFVRMSDGAFSERHDAMVKRTNADQRRMRREFYRRFSAKMPMRLEQVEAGKLHRGLQFYECWAILGTPNSTTSSESALGRRTVATWTDSPFGYVMIVFDDRTDSILSLSVTRGTP